MLLYVAIILFWLKLFYDCPGAREKPDSDRLLFYTGEIVLQVLVSHIFTILFS